jgi:hypothetical protein
MAKTVIEAFNRFLADTVNLAPDKTKSALRSRDWLFTQIQSFQSDSTFPVSYSVHDIPYGSFARKTKKRPLDDIDLLICLSAQGASYDETAGIEGIPIKVNPNSNLTPFCFDDSYFLNSRKVINKFIQKLSAVPQYAHADLRLDGSAAVLNLQSYDWSFDIVPCFMTEVDMYGKTHYLIPDGTGRWKKTDPRIDRARVAEINQKHNGNVLNIIRVMKYWNGRPTMPTMRSYLLEAMILDFYDDDTLEVSEYVDWEIPRLMEHLAGAVYGIVQDPKGIQGDINNLSWDEMEKISTRAKLDSDRAYEAVKLETSDPQAAIKKWGEVFGPKFPAYD